MKRKNKKRREGRRKKETEKERQRERKKKKKKENISLPVAVITHRAKRKLNCLLTSLLWFESELPSPGVLPNTQFPQTIFCGW
jgi:hypothetical protein